MKLKFGLSYSGRPTKTRKIVKIKKIERDKNGIEIQIHERVISDTTFFPKMTSK